MTRVFLVERQPGVRSGWHGALLAEGSLQVVGEAASAQELVQQLPTAAPDVALLGIEEPWAESREAIHRLHAAYPCLRLLLLSAMSQPLCIKQAFEAGGLGYLPKSVPPTELLAAVRLVALGQPFLSTELSLRLLDSAVVAEARPPAPAPQQGVRLSRREREVLQLVAQGLTTQQIATKLFASKRTIETHRQNILEKTGSKNTAVLIHYALTQGMLPPG